MSSWCSSLLCSRALALAFGEERMAVVQVGGDRGTAVAVVGLRGEDEAAGGVDDQQVGDRQKRGSGKQEQPAVQQREPQPERAPRQVRTRRRQADKWNSPEFAES